jgi:crossover junction endodeoxyribonuclease RuvC
MRFLGLDPGLTITGWGVVEARGSELAHVADGAVRPDASAPMGARLRALHEGLAAVIARYAPDEAAVEETFVNRNAASALRLGQARGVVLLAPALVGILVAEYPANTVKKSVVGAGHAAKQQVGMMVKTLLPGAACLTEDAADALAVAICHAHYSRTRLRVADASAGKPGLRNIAGARA